VEELAYYRSAVFRPPESERPSAGMRVGTPEAR